MISPRSQPCFAGVARLSPSQRSDLPCAELGDWTVRQRGRRCVRVGRTRRRSDPATLALSRKCDRAASRAGVTPMPRQQPSRPARRTTGSPRLSGSHAARGRRHPPRYRFPDGIRPDRTGQEARSDRPTSVVRVIATRGTHSSGLDRRGLSFRVNAIARPLVTALPHSHVLSQANEVAVTIAFATRVAAAHIASATIRLRRLELSGRKVFRQSEREPRPASYVGAGTAGRRKVGYLSCLPAGAVSENTQTVRRWARVSVIASGAFGALRSSEPIATAA